jgi:uncharacterized protein YndB with AHSA1/START domain
MKRIEITRMLSASPEDVFAAWTDPALMAQWFYAHPTWTVDVDADVRVGGSYSLTMKSPDGEEFETHGEYREIEPPTRLVFTWNSYIVDNTVVTIELRPDGDRTELRLTHELFETDEIRERHTHGWVGCLDSLERFTAG